jgi:putative DNA primase/helicase
MDTTLDDPEDAASLFSSLYDRQTGLLELRSFDNKGLRAREFLEVKGGVLDMPRVGDFVRTTEQQQVGAYFGVALRTQSALEDKKGDESHCQTLTTLFVDADFKHMGEEETRRRLNAFPLSPSVVVHSGGGLHAYWVLQDPIFLQMAGGMQQAKALLRRLALQLKDVVDVDVSEPARVLRIPGSTNFKPTYNKPRVVLETVP